MSVASPSRYELIVNPARGVRLDAVDAGVFFAAGVTGCVDYSASTGACLVRVTGKGDPAAVAKELMKQGGKRFQSVLPNAPIYIEPTGSGDSPATDMSQPACTPTAPGNVCPEDPLFPQQHELIDLGALQAWASITSSSPVVTAMIDTGVQEDHPDLQCNLVQGKDFTCDAENCSTQPSDTDGHGTRMTGIIAACANKIGVRGVAWNTRVMPLKILAGTSSTDWEAGQAIEYAVANHASVINASWMSLCPTPTVRNALKSASDRGVLLVSAAGNDGQNLELPGNARYPAMYNLPNTVTVMSYSDGWQPTVSSNWGLHTVDLAAPGGGYSTQLCDNGECYGLPFDDSTSAATAYVSGAAALIKSVHPDWRAEWIKMLLIDSAIPEPSLKGKSRSGARLSLLNAMVGPLKVVAPAPKTHWQSQPSEVKWTNTYRTSLCASVDIDMTSDGVQYSRLLSDSANIGEAMVYPDPVSAPQTFWIRISCQPAGFQAVSGPFTLDAEK
jgi:subtilisin family serine protease